MQDIIEILQELEDWQELAGWMGIKAADITNIKKNCQSSVVHAQCQWRNLVKRYCYMNAADNPYKAAADIADILESKMGKKNQAQKLKNLPFTRE